MNVTDNKAKCLICVLSLLFSFFLFDAGAETENGRLSVGNDMMVGMPFGMKADEADLDLCPQGAGVIKMFLVAWQKEDYKTMYELLDEGSKEDYPFQEARFDFMVLKFKPYDISSVRKSGENFEFLLSYGDWKEGDKDLRKMVISGKTFKIIMPSRHSPFKKSAEDYF